MSEIIKLTDFKGVFSNCDKEAMPPEFLAELENFRPKNFRLVKTFGLGSLIGTAITNTGSYETTNLFTYIESNLTTPTGYAIILCEQHETNGTVKLHKWNGSNWANITLSTTVYHKAGTSYINPVFQDSDILRFLPGNCALVGSNAAKGLWYGYIDRDYFDGNYSPTAQFYDYETVPAKPTYDWTVTEIGDTGMSAFTSGQTYYYRFSAIYDGVQESLLSDVFAFFKPTAANKYPVLQCEDITKTAFNKRITAFKIYRSENATANFSHIHTIDLQRLSADITKANTGAYLGKDWAHVPGLTTFGFDASMSYKLNVKSLDDSTYYKKAIVNPETNDGNVTSAATAGGGAQTQFNTAAPHGMTAGQHVTLAGFVVEATYNGTWYIDAVTSTSFTITVAFVQTDTGTWDEVSTGHTVFQYDTAEVSYEAWNTDWQLLNAADDSVLYEGINGCYTGYTSVIVSSTLDKGEFAGGLFLLATDVGTVTAAATAYTGTKTTFTSAAHGLSAGQTVTLVGFDPCTTYNGTWTIYKVTADTFTISVAFDANDTGTWHLKLEETKRVLDDNSSRAVHFTDTLTTGSSTAAWELLNAETGLYEWYSNSTAWCRFYDIGLPDGSPPLLEGETSITVNGRYAKVVGDRLFQGYIYLDPGGANEEHKEWLSYSELGQLDVNPVSNVKRMRDIEGGDITGIQEVFGNLVVLKEQMVAMLNMKDYPTIPENWEVIQSIHNIGNIAPYGSIEVQGNLYICFYDGIYRLRPNNLAPTDQTPTEVLRISDPIGDVYVALTAAVKKAIKTGYDQTKSEVIFRLSSAEVWAYSILTETWRQIESSKDFTFMATDEEANLITYYNSDRKIYTLKEGDAKEATYGKMKTKTFAISEDSEEVVRRLVATYKSDDPLMLKIYAEEDVYSGDITGSASEKPGGIQKDGMYYVRDYTTVVYNGTTYTDGDVFKGVAGCSMYSYTGTGTVEEVRYYKLPDTKKDTTAVVKKYTLGPRYRAKSFVVEINNGEFGVQAANHTTHKFTIDGKWTDFFPAAGTFSVSGSTANDEDYTVTSSTYNGTGTEILVDESPDLTDSTADGIIKVTSDNTSEIHSIYIEHD